MCFLKQYMAFQNTACTGMAFGTAYLAESMVWMTRHLARLVHPIVLTVFAACTRGIFAGSGSRYRIRHWQLQVGCTSMHSNSDPSCFVLAKHCLDWCLCKPCRETEQYLAVSLCRVTAHFVPVQGQAKPKTVILVKFDASVMKREERLPS